VNCSPSLLVEASNAEGGEAGFSEAGDLPMIRHATLAEPGMVAFGLESSAPQNEDDAEKATRLLCAALESLRSHAKFLGPGDRDDDFLIELDGAQLGVQVVRAYVEAQFWAGLSRSKHVEDSVSDSRAAQMLQQAIEHKTKIPPSQRARMLLLLDATRLPFLVLAKVSEQFRDTYGSWCGSLGFAAIYVMGPNANWCARLDH
jgi:hypothetical protein